MLRFDRGRSETYRRLQCLGIVRADPEIRTGVMSGSKLKLPSTGLSCRQAGAMNSTTICRKKKLLDRYTDACKPRARAGFEIIHKSQSRDEPKNRPITNRAKRCVDYMKARRVPSNQQLNLLPRDSYCYFQGQTAPLTQACNVHLGGTECNAAFYTRTYV